MWQEGISASPAGSKNAFKSTWKKKVQFFISFSKQFMVLCIFGTPCGNSYLLVVPTSYYGTKLVMVHSWWYTFLPSWRIWWHMPLNMLELQKPMFKSIKFSASCLRPKSQWEPSPDISIFTTDPITIGRKGQRQITRRRHKDRSLLVNQRSQLSLFVFSLPPPPLTAVQHERATRTFVKQKAASFLHDLRNHLHHGAITQPHIGQAAQLPAASLASRFHQYHSQLLQSHVPALSPSHYYSQFYQSCMTKSTHQQHHQPPIFSPAALVPGLTAATTAAASPAPLAIAQESANHQFSSDENDSNKSPPPPGSPIEEVTLFTFTNTIGLTNLILKIVAIIAPNYITPEFVPTIKPT